MVISILTLILLFVLILMITLFFVTPTQWLLRSRPFAQPYGSFFCPIAIYQFFATLILSFEISKYLSSILIVLYFLLPTLQIFIQKFRTSYTDLQLNLYSFSLTLSIIHSIRITLENAPNSNLLSEFYEFLFFGLLSFGISSKIQQIIHNDCCTYQQIGQLLEFDTDQFARQELKEYQFQLVLLKLYHDKYLITPYCPFKRKDVQETWFFNEKSSLSHFLNSMFSLRENLKSVSFTLSSIIFTYRYLKYPLQALFLIHRFQQANENIGSYPQLVLSIVQEQIKYNCRIDQCSQLRQKINLSDMIYQLNVFQFYKSQTIFQEYIKLQKPIVLMKINYWQKLIDGYNTIEELKLDTINIIKKINTVEKLMKKNLDMKNQIYKPKIRGDADDYCFQRDDIIILKMFSWYFTFVLNDFRKTFRVEAKLNDLLSRDRGSSYKLNNFMIYHKKSLLLIMKGFSNKGTMINKNINEISNFFQFDDKNFHLYKQINHLMPSFISDRHNDIVENFICKGFSNLFYASTETFSVNEKGFINPICLQLGNCIENNSDFLLTASFIKVKQTQDFIIFDSKGQIKEVTFNFFKNCILPYQSTTNFDIFNFKSYSFLQFFFGIQINKMIEVLRQSEHNEYYISEDRMIFQCPRELDSIQKEFDEYTKKNALLRMNRTSRFSKTNTKFNTFRTQEGYKFDDEDKMKDIEDSLQMIKGSHIELLNEEYQDTVESFLGDPSLFNYYNNKKDTEPKQIIFSLSFNQIGLDKYPFFVMEIKEIKSKTKTIENLSEKKKKQSKIMQHDSQSIRNEDGSNFNIKATPISNSNSSLQNINKNEQKNLLIEVNQRFDEFSQSVIQSDLQMVYNLNDKQMNGSLNAPSLAKPKFIYPSSSQINNVEDESDNVMDNELNELKKQQQRIMGISKKGQKNRLNLDQNIEFDQDIEQDYRVEIQKFKSLTTQKKNYLNENEKENEQLIEDSLGSHSSGSNYFLNLLYKKAHKNVISRALLKVIFMNFFIFILIFASFFINYKFISDQMKSQKVGLIKIRNHVIFNQQFSDIQTFTQIYLIQQFTKDVVSYSDYFNNFIHYSMHDTYRSFLDEYQDLFQILKVVDDQNQRQMKIAVINDLQTSIFLAPSSQYLQILTDSFKHIIDFLDHYENFLDNSDALSSILFFRLNMQNQNFLMNDIIDVGTFLNDEIENKTQNQFILRITIEICLIVLLVLIQYVFFKENQKKEEELMLALVAYHQIEAENAIYQQFMKYLLFSYKYFTNLLNQTPNLFKIESSKIIYRKQKNRQGMYSNIKVTSNLASRIKSLKFSMIRSLIILLINILLVVFYYLGCYIFFATLDQSSSFLMDLSFHAIELQHHTDDLLSIGYTIKVDPFLIDDFFINKVNKNFDLKNVTNEIFSQLTFNYENLIEAKFSFFQKFLFLDLGDQNDRNKLDDFYKRNLCKVIPENFYFCGSNDTKYLDFGIPSQKNNNQIFISEGLEGVFTQIIKTFNQQFDQELTFHKYETNKQILLEFLNSDVETTIFFSYILEVKLVVALFVDIIYQMALKNIDQVILNITLFIFLGGFFFIFLIGFFLFFGLIKIHQNYHLLKKGFILIPYQALLQQNLSKSINLKLD